MCIIPLKTFDLHVFAKIYSLRKPRPATVGLYLPDEVEKDASKC